MFAIVFSLAAFWRAELQAGSITGWVFDDSDPAAPVADLWVDIYDINGKWLFGKKTDVFGMYVLPNLTSGLYKINYYTSGTQYITEWYNNKFYFSDALEVNVAGDVTLDNVQLVTSSVVISGYVKNSSNEGVSGVYVQVYAENGDWVTTSETDSNGWYSIIGLRTGEYTLRFLASETDYITEWHNNKNNELLADKITITTLNDTVSIDTVLDRGGSISGKITDSLTGNPIQNAWIDVYDKNLDTNGQPIWRGYAKSAADGSYLVKGLPSGEHKIEVFKAYKAKPKEWYENRGSFSFATPVSVTTGGETSGINLALGGSETDANLSQVYNLILLRKSCVDANRTPVHCNCVVNGVQAYCVR